MLILLIRFLCFMNCHVVSGSMEPTLMTHDYAIFQCIDKNISTGDIVCFKDEEGATVGKRIIGIPGDFIEFHNGNVYVNGSLLDESAYLDESVESNCARSFSVPENSYFVLGDNREDSYDSRFWKQPFVPSSAIKGKLFLDIPTSKIFNN